MYLFALGLGLKSYDEITSGFCSGISCALSNGGAFGFSNNLKEKVNNLYRTLWLKEKRLSFFNFLSIFENELFEKSRLNNLKIKILNLYLLLAAIASKEA